MTADVDVMEEGGEIRFTAAEDGECSDSAVEQGAHLDAMDREQLQQHIQGLQQKLAKQKPSRALRC